MTYRLKRIFVPILFMAAVVLLGAPAAPFAKLVPTVGGNAHAEWSIIGYWGYTSPNCSGEGSYNSGMGGLGNYGSVRFLGYDSDSGVYQLFGCSG